MENRLWEIRIIKFARLQTLLTQATDSISRITMPAYTLMETDCFPLLTLTINSTLNKPAIERQTRFLDSYEEAQRPPRLIQRPTSDF